MKIDGRKIASKILEDLKIKVEDLKQKNIIPHLAIILVGNDPASIAYVRQKKIKGEQIGAKISILHLPSKILTPKLLATTEQLNNDNNIHGIIVQQPLPSHIDVKQITQAIDPRKDVDGFHSNSQFEMPIALAVLEILKFESIKNKQIVVMGKGETGGKPIIQMLEKIGAKPIVIDSKTKNPESLTKTADIIISAVGKSNVVKPDMIKKEAILISIGMHKGIDSKLHGDYEEEKIKNIVSFYTPTPGGVGPVNVSMLLKNLVLAAEL